MISEGFVTNGATVYITGRDVPACDKAVKELNALAKGKAVSLPANLYNEEECKKLFDEFSKRENSMSSLQFVKYYSDIAYLSYQALSQKRYVMLLRW